MVCETDCRREIEIVQGADEEFSLRFRTCDDGRFYDFINATALKAIFKGVSANVELLLSAAEIEIVGATANGEILFKMSAAKSLLLLVANLQDAELEVTEGAKKKVFKINSLITVKGRV